VQLVFEPSFAAKQRDDEPPGLVMSVSSLEAMGQILLPFVGGSPVFVPYQHPDNPCFRPHP